MDPVQTIGINGVVAVAAGKLHSLALKTDGTVWAWGDDALGGGSAGQLGNGSAAGSITPVQVVINSGGTTNLTGIIAIASGEYHSLALRNDGTVWAWGEGSNGQLGINSTADRSYAVQVRAGDAGGTYLTGITAISAGRVPCSYAVRNDGTVWAWGAGQLGDNTTTGKLTPVQVLAGASGGTYLTGITALAGAQIQTFALRGSDGTVWAWGSNSVDGTLGDNTFIDRLTPVQVLAGASGGTYLTGITALAQGWDKDQRSLALRSDGTVWNWGTNAEGFGEGYIGINDGVTQVFPTPVQVLAGAGGGTYLTGITAVAGGRFHSLALRSNGTVWTWGRNGQGSLGDGTNTNRWTPVQVISLCSVGNLPVELLHFTPKCIAETQNFVSLQWATASEENNDYFEIEASPGPSEGGVTEWTSIGIVKGAGNSSTTNNYEFIDPRPPSFWEGTGVGLYRLKQTDYNGSYIYSPIASLRFPCQEEDISILPNPSSGIFAISGLPPNCELSAFNVLGEKVYSDKIPNPKPVVSGAKPSLIFNLDLPNGIYFLRISPKEFNATAPSGQGKTGRTINAKIVMQK